MILNENAKFLIPQKYPIIMIGQLIYSDELITRSNFLIAEDNIFVESGEFGEAGLIENIAQTAAARVGFIAKTENKAIPIGFIGAIKNLIIFSRPKVNELIETEIKIVNQIFNATIITGSVTCKSQVLISCEMKIIIP